MVASAAPMRPSDPEPVFDAIEGLLRSEPPSWLAVLGHVLDHTQCPVGTLHLTDADGELALVAQRGLPPPVAAVVARIPIGKGMAGIAAERREPVQVCNLQEDTSGVVRPGAKLTRMEGSIACPILHEQRVHGVLGVAKPTPYEFTPAETEFLMEVGRRIARRVWSLHA